MIIFVHENFLMYDIYSSVHYAGEQPCRFTINWLLSTVYKIMWYIWWTTYKCWWIRMWCVYISGHFSSANRMILSVHCFIMHVIIVLAYIKFSNWSQNCQTTKLNHRQMYCVYGNKQMWSNYLSIINVQPHNLFVPSLKVVLKCICVDFKCLLNS